MTDEAKKIVDALRCCYNASLRRNCAECPIDRESDCENLETNAADLIERLSEELERVKMMQKTTVHQYGENCTNITNCGKLELNL